MGQNIKWKKNNRTILYGEEVVIILVTTAFFLGLSISYFLSLKFYEKFFTISFLSSLFSI